METIKNNIPSEKNSPLMEQYFSIKENYPDELLLFQVGDFYELFFEDAKVASSYLAIALTKRGKNRGEDIPLCGIPVHTLNHYINKLIKGGFRVAICDQLTKPIQGNVVERGITRVLTPGTLTDTTLLDEKSASYILSFYPTQERWGLLFAELLTAQILATSVPTGAIRTLDTELTRFFPDEILIPQEFSKDFKLHFGQQGYFVSNVLTSGELLNESSNWVEKQFTPSIKVKLTECPAVLSGLEQLYCYLKKNQAQALPTLKTLQFYEPEDYLVLDNTTQKNLELIKNRQDDSPKNTLLSVLDQAKTPMGSRTIKKWLLRPLVQRSVILQRQEIVSLIASHPDIILTLEKELEKLSDIERIIGRIALDRATINDYLSLKESLKIIPIIKNIINTKINTPLGLTLSERLIDLNVLKDFLDASINNNPEYNWRVKSGFDLALDRLRSLVKDGHKEILALESREISSTGINSLKIGYNQISGYYIEVTAPNLSKVPEHYQHIQTLANRTRFTTQELKLLETEIFKAQNEIESTESLVFSRITKEISGYLSQLRQISQSLAYLDGLFGFAKAAYNFNYSFPSFNNTHDIIITQGRHPVVEQANLIKFIPNDTKLTNQESLWIITGPNMGGKSTYLRQVALICIMAHCGSGVPAQQASIPILDRIFTRIGAGDNVSEGKSTFLVEMEETATICTQATEKSLVVLDEVGRGTSTYDGIALAHAIIEHIANNIKAKCLFATHYHELTTLSKESLGILNYHMACQPKGDNILFLYTMIPGVAPGSFGLQVARMAQLPESIIIRAKEILNIIFSQEKESATQLYKKQADIPENQEFSPELREFLTRFKNYNLDELSGRQALDLLWALKELL